MQLYNVKNSNIILAFQHKICNIRRTKNKMAINQNGDVSWFGLKWRSWISRVKSARRDNYSIETPKKKFPFKIAASVPKWPTVNKMTGGWNNCFRTKLLHFATKYDYPYILAGYTTVHLRKKIWTHIHI